MQEVPTWAYVAELEAGANRGSDRLDRRSLFFDVSTLKLQV